MPLPPPSTTSPGKICLRYTAVSVDHEICSNCRAAFDITDLAEVASVALAFGTLVADCMVNTNFITGWRLADPTGLTLAEGTFPVPLTGTNVAGAGSFFSQSATIGLSGKGSPGVGLAAGQTRAMIFAGYLTPSSWNNPRCTLAEIGGATALRNFLNSTDDIGADFYGSEGIWRSYVNTQVNAHYQKTLGV